MAGMGSEASGAELTRGSELGRLGGGARAGKESVCGRSGVKSGAREPMTGAVLPSSFKLFCAGRSTYDDFLMPIHQLRRGGPSFTQSMGGGDCRI